MTGLVGVPSRAPKLARLLAAVGSWVAAGLVLALPARANPPLANPSFEILGPNGSPTVHSPPVPGGAGPSAAESWGVFHNTAGGPNTSVTELVATTLPLPGVGTRMIHVETDGVFNGIVQTTGPTGSGPPSCTASAWLFVNSGVVGMGAGNGGATQATSILTTTTGAWEHLQVENLDSPCNEIVFYSIGGGADYYVESAEIKEYQVAEVISPLEYSNALDESAVLGGGNHNGLDPGQVLYTEPPDTPFNVYPRNVVDFFPLLESGNEPDAQVDALAHGCDGFFNEVRDNEVRLLISIEADPGPGQNIAAYYEDSHGATGVQYTHRDLNDPNFPGDLDDVDGLELWRLMDAGASLSDANFFSTLGDTGGASVYSNLTGTPLVYLTPAQIFSAIVPLGFAGTAGEVDLDALMVKDTGTAGVWDRGDEILFSVRTAGGWTGGEIVHFPFGGPAAFLIHGGHSWDTSFVLSSVFPVDDIDREVDAIEAAPEPFAQLPLLSLPGLALLAGALAMVGSAAAAGQTVKDPPAKQGEFGL
jgi:hypothetical protein